MQCGDTLAPPYSHVKVSFFSAVSEYCWQCTRVLPLHPQHKPFLLKEVTRSSWGMSKIRCLSLLLGATRLNEALDECWHSAETQLHRSCLTASMMRQCTVCLQGFGLQEIAVSQALGCKSCTWSSEETC